MKILSIDTSSNICGVSILEDNNLICKLDKNTGRTHSENLMQMIEKAFNQTNLKLSDIDLMVCDNGPGSFTGIRIGISTVKAFHDSLSIPCICVSSLEALAYAIKDEGLIASILDCKNDNCYFALYELKNSTYNEVISPNADTIENALDKISSISTSNITFVGDACKIFMELITTKFNNFSFSAPENNLLNSYNLGLAGLQKFKENKFNDILPLYLKKPQAQRQLEEKSKNVKIETMTIDDLNQISDVLLSDFDDFWNYEVLKNELTSTNSMYLVAKLDNMIIGFAGIKIMLDEADIMNIVVKKDFRNQGIGGLLLKNLIALSKEQKCNYITLEVMEENYSAIHLYKNFGFEQTGIRKNYYKNKNALIFTKKTI